MRHLALCALLLAACSSGKRAPQLSAADARDVLIDRNWLDRMPETRDDRLHVYRFVPSMGGGVFQDRTLFKGTFELFSFQATGDTITFDLHQTNDTVKTTFRIEPVDGPAPFDLKLSIRDDPRGPHVYYGIRAETDRDGSALERRIAALPAHRE